MSDSFTNVSRLDFSRRDIRSQMSSALRRVRTQLGVEYNLIIGGDRVKAPEQFASRNPGKRDESLALFQHASTGMAARAAESASAALRQWRDTDPGFRAETLVRAATIAKDRRFELNAWLVLELGKSWSEADAESSEAIDLLRYSACRVLTLQGATSVARGTSIVRHAPFGAAAILTAWNAPLASLAGAVGAAIAVGSPTVIKPSSQSPAVSRQLVAILLEAGVPANVLNFVTGPGETVGRTLIEHPMTRLVCYSGPSEVALEVSNTAYARRDGCRMLLDPYEKADGIVDADVDPVRAARAIVQSAFRFQGQARSSAGTFFVDAAVFDDVVDGVVTGARELRIGSPEEAETDIGPVISGSNYNEIMRAIEVEKGRGRMVAGGEGLSRDGHYVQPTVFVVDDAERYDDAPAIAGPVLTLVRVPSVSEALRLVATRKRATCAFHSRDEETLRAAIEALDATRLLLNEPLADAPVGDGPAGTSHHPDWVSGSLTQKRVSRGSG